MPRKLAIVLEGQTELAFVERLIREIAGAENVRIRKCLARGGAHCNRSFVELEVDPDGAQPFFCLLYCSGTDSRVASDVRDNYDGWCRADFVGIISLRDIYPAEGTAIPAIQQATTFRQKTRPILVQNVLAVREIEAWFLAEESHFASIHPALVPERITQHLGFDALVDDVEARAHPSADLDAAYSLEGLRYTKQSNRIQRTVECLNYENLYVDVRTRVPWLNVFITALDAYFGGMSWNENVPRDAVLNTP